MPSKKLTPDTTRHSGERSDSRIKPKKDSGQARMTKKASTVIPAKAGIQTKATTSKSTGLTANIFDMLGKSVGTMILPKEIFGQTPNQTLLAQAIRVYQANSIKHTAHTKTRGEVRGGGAKPWRQKGTGNARAGSRRSPLWVHGGTTFGPRYRDVKLNLPQKMRQKALTLALSDKAKQESKQEVAVGV